MTGAAIIGESLQSGIVPEVEVDTDAATNSRRNEPSSFLLRYYLKCGWRWGVPNSACQGPSVSPLHTAWPHCRLSQDHRRQSQRHIIIAVENLTKRSYQIKKICALWELDLYIDGAYSALGWSRTMSSGTIPTGERMLWHIVEGCICSNNPAPINIYHHNTKQSTGK